jgi:transposase-like protein
MDTQSLTRAQALADLKTLREAGSGKMLAERWGVHPATASRWLNEWRDEGAISRQRDGKAVRALIVGPVRQRA